MDSVKMLFLYCVCLFGVSEGLNGYEKVMNCKKLDCPFYSVIYTSKEFEIRQYEEALWMATHTINSSTFDNAVNKGFSTLFGYIEGNNDQSVKIPMTAPVLVDVHPSTGPFCNSSFIIYFYMPEKYQTAANPPLSAQTLPTKLPPRSGRLAAVRRFGGFMHDRSIANEVMLLSKSIKATKWRSAIRRTNGEAPATYSVAGYNSPLELDNRINEIIIWIST